MAALTTMLWLGAALLAVLGLLAWRRPRRPRPMALRRGVAVAVVLLALALAGLGGLLRQYAWLVQDRPVATLAFRQLAPQRYAVVLAQPGRAPREAVLAGDEWQLDARVLRWELPALAAGLPPLYRLERLSGRYADPGQAAATAPVVLDLREGWDRWRLRQRLLARLPLADARWGSGAYLPMLDGARYEVGLSATGGLVARPADPATEALLRAAGW